LSARTRASRFLQAILLLFTLCTSAHADLVSALSATRARGCGRIAGVSGAWHEEDDLNDAARRMARGASLKDAVLDSGYQAQRSAEIHVRAPNDAALVDVVRDRFCALVIDSDLKDIGIYRRGDETWIVLAQALNTPRMKDAGAVNQRVLALVNQARAQARRCGREHFNAAPPLTLSPVLEKAAAEHARDMARYAYMSHAGHDASTPEQRITNAGYRWRMAGENVAMGSPNADAVMQGWLASPGHCANIMAPGFKETAVAYALNPKTEYGIYWTQVFGTKQ
jgi:uncharacterized protein YkwD